MLSNYHLVELKLDYLLVGLIDVYDFFIFYFFSRNRYRPSYKLVLYDKSDTLNFILNIFN